jgi:hypothetical protein
MHVNSVASSTTYTAHMKNCANRSAVFQMLIIYNIHAHTLYFCTCSSSCNFEQGIGYCFTNTVQNKMAAATLVETKNVTVAEHRLAAELQENYHVYSDLQLV